MVLCSISSFRSEIVTLRFSLNFEMLTKQKLILGSSILHNFSLSSLWNQNLIGIWAIIWFFELLEPRFFWSNLSFSFCMYMSDYLAKLLVWWTHCTFTFSCENSFPLSVCLYTVNIVILLKQPAWKNQKKMKIDLELRWILAVLAAELEDTWKLNVYELPHMLPVMKLYEENCRSNSAAKSQYSVLFYA